jgi:uncharacterized protein
MDRMSQAVLGLGGYFSNPEENPVEIIKYAYESGIKFFDTAPAYGDSEKWFGEALEEYFRGSYVLCTKTKAETEEQLYESFLQTLKNLKTFYVDIYFGHDYINDIETWNRSKPALNAMYKLKTDGLIAKIGVSGHSAPAAIEAINSGIVDYIMVPHSIMYRVFEEVIRYAEYKKVKVITMKNFGSGILLGGPGENEFKKQVTMKDIVSFSSFFNGVSTIIPAARSKKQVDEIIDAYDNSSKLTSTEVSNLENRIIHFLGKDFCRFCNMCRPCDVYGWQMSQPGILKSLLYHESFNLDMTETYHSYKLNSDDCEGCNNLCATRCPFGIDIKGQMQNIHSFFTNKEAN